MKPGDLWIRPILPGDNPQVADVIRDVFRELHIPEVGTAIADPSLEAMYGYYQAPRSAYWVVADTSLVWGGGGLAPLEGEQGNVCELQKMYFRTEIRGQGWGERLLRMALEKAEYFGYARCYLETMPYMKAAQNLYRGYGFRYLDGPKGRTGHTACSVWMEKELGNR